MATTTQDPCGGVPSPTRAGQCAAKSKRSGQQCQQTAMIGKAVCYMHGGNSPRGIASPSFRHGRYSRALPLRMLADYRRTARDPALLELRQEIAVVQARAVDLLKRVDSGESGHLWKRLQATWDEVEAAQRAKDMAALAAALTELGLLIRRGAADYAAWEEVGRQLDRQQRLVESERRRAVEQQQMVAVDELLTLVAALTEAVRRHVSDRGVLGAISAEFTKLLATSVPDSRQALVAEPIEEADPTAPSSEQPGA